MQEKVKEFQIMAGSTLNDVPTLLDKKILNLRYDLKCEELSELKYAIETNDIVEIADALGDLLYLILGTSVSMGINLEQVFDEIHKSNMTKKSSDGVLIKRADGKILKPDTYVKPDIERILKEQGWTENILY